MKVRSKHYLPFRGGDDCLLSKVRADDVVVIDLNIMSIGGGCLTEANRVFGWWPLLSNKQSTATYKPLQVRSWKSTYFPPFASATAF